MSAPVKAVQSVPYAIAELAAGANGVSSVIDVSEFFSAAIFWDFSPAAATASAAATVLQILASNKLISGVVNDEDDAWSIIQDWLSPTAQAVEFTGVVGTAGASTFDVTNASGLVLFQDHCIEGGSVSEGACEWVYPIGVSSNTITVRSPLKNTYASGTLRSGALKQRFDLDLSNVGKMKFVIGNNRGGTERDVLNRIRMIALESVSAD